MALKIDFVNSIWQQIIDSLNSSKILKDGGRVVSAQRLKERIESEGIAYTFSVRQIGTLFIGSTITIGDIIANSPMKAFYIKTLALSSSHGASYTLTGGRRGGIGNPEFQVLEVSRGVTQLLEGEGILIKPNQDKLSLSMGTPTDLNPLLIHPQINGNLTVTKSNITSATNNRYAYTITVANTTGSSTSGTITLLDGLPPGARFSSGIGTGWTVSESGGVITASTSNVIANNGTNVIIINLESKIRVTGSLSAMGMLVDHDIDLDAPAGVYCGTSITAESSPSTYKMAYTYKLRNWLRDVRGVNSRVINRAVSGTSSVFHETERAFNGLYDFREKPLFAVYEQAGINDEVQLVPLATSLDNMRQHIAHYRRTQGNNFPIFVLAPIPNGNSGNEAGLVTRRAAMKANLISLADSRVYYVEAMGTAWNAATESGTYTVDGTHPNDAGNDRMFTIFSNFISTNNIQF